jgi:RND family efflux transporter MFP subunit
LIVIIALGAALFSWKESLLPWVAERTENSPPVRPASQKASAVKVITETVVMTANDRNFRAIGTGRARLSVDLYSPVTGKVTQIAFTPQQTVRKGELLLQMDNREEKLALKAAQVDRNNARKLLDRYQTIIKTGNITETQLDSARAAYDSAQVALEQAQLALDEHIITAPFSGVVGIAQVDVGDQITPQTMITSIDARDVLFVDFDVPEALAGKLLQAQQNKQTISATTPAYPAETFSGIITQQDSRLDIERRTLMARASIDNSDDRLRPGMSFETLWKIPGKSFATVTEIAVQWGREGSFIWVIREDEDKRSIANKVSVKVVSRKAGRVLLDGDVKAGEAVVVEGLQRLRPGRSVEILNQ